MSLAERLQQTRNGLPDDAEAPLVLRYDPTLEPVLRLAVVGPHRNETPFYKLLRF